MNSDSTKRFTRHLLLLVFGGATASFLLLGCKVAPKSTRSPRASSTEQAELVARGSGLSLFAQAPQGCSGAHCDMRNGDNARLPSAPKGSTLLVKRTDFRGSLVGLGCSSNGTTFACSFGPDGVTANVAVFDANGVVKWVTGPGIFSSFMSGLAVGSAPLIDASGQVIATDQRHITRFDARGKVLWDAIFPSNSMPVSPVLLSDGSIALGRSRTAESDNGSFLVYRSTDGALLGELVLRVAPDSTEILDTVNTPAVRGLRTYVLTRCSYCAAENEKLGRLVAIDFNPQEKDPTKSLSIAWSFDFQSPAGASPTVIGDTVYFDGMGASVAGPTQPTIFAVKDVGSSYELVFAKSPLTLQAQASFAPDPRGGLWLYGLNETTLVRISEKDGDILQKIDLSKHIAAYKGLAYGPTSALTMAGTPERPILHVGAKVTSKQLQGPSYVLGLDVTQESVEWQVQLSSINDVPAGQFPVVRDSAGNSRVVFTSFFSGPYIVGAPPAKRR